MTVQLSPQQILDAAQQTLPSLEAELARLHLATNATNDLAERTLGRRNIAMLEARHDYISQVIAAGGDLSKVPAVPAAPVGGLAGQSQELGQPGPLVGPGASLFQPDVSHAAQNPNAPPGQAHP